MKILLVRTGGTIDSAEKDGFLSPFGNRVDGITPPFEKDGVVFDTVCPYTVLSENLTAEHLNQLLETMRENLHKGYDGVIVTLGTDTLQYVAAALGFAFGDTLPIFTVSANFPLPDPRSNGCANFAAAIDGIRRGKTGVFTPYQSDETTETFLSTRLSAFPERSDRLWGWQGISPVFATPEKVRNGVFREKSGVQVVTPAPAQSYHLDPDVKAVLLQPYHSATLPTADPAFQGFCRQAKGKGIPLYLTNTLDEIPYASSAVLDDLGVTVLPPCGSAAIYVKLWCIHSTGVSDSEIHNPWYGEFL